MLSQGPYDRLIKEGSHCVFLGSGGCRRLLIQAVVTNRFCDYENDGNEVIPKGDPVLQVTLSPPSFSPHVCLKIGKGVGVPLILSLMCFLAT